MVLATEEVKPTAQLSSAQTTKHAQCFTQCLKPYCKGDLAIIYYRFSCSLAHLFYTFLLTVWLQLLKLFCN